MLDDLDRELWGRGHRFVRYADDVRVFVRSERAARRVLGHVTDVVERRLKLKVNRAKSGVRHARQATLLGFGFYLASGRARIRVDPKAIRRMRQRIRLLTGRNRRIAMEERIEALNRYIAGWCAYFALAETPAPFVRVDSWLRRRLRQVRWKEWKLPKARVRAIRALGIPAAKAYEWGNSSKGHWRVARSGILQHALPNAYWTDLGLRGFADNYHRLRNT